jgi:hypothetical protein
LASGSTQWLATADTDAVHVTPGYFWSEVQISSQNGHKVKVDGIPNAEAAKMMSAISSAAVLRQAEEDRRTRMDCFKRLVLPLMLWFHAMTRDLTLLAKQRR